MDDLGLPNQLRCVFVRSNYAHAVLKSVDVTRACNVRGVVSILRSDDLSSVLRPIRPSLPSSYYREIRVPHLAHRKVRYVGEPVAAVIAEDLDAALDAAEQVDIEYDPLKPVTSAQSALSSGAPLLYEEWGDNVFYRRNYEHGDAEGAFASADKVVSHTFRAHRQAAAPLEPRGSLASFDAGRGSLTYLASRQDVHIDRALISTALGLPESDVRVISPDVGGAFGLKHGLYPEDLVVPAASLLLKRPVKWVESRYEEFLAGAQAREQTHVLQLAVKGDGRITALKDRILGDLGGALLYPHHGGNVLDVSSDHILGQYSVENLSLELVGVMTNKAPYGSYRGFGRPEATFALERMVDLTSRELSMDPVDFRAANLIAAFPYKSATGLHHDSGNYRNLLRLALDAVGYRAFRAEQGRLRAAGRYLGIGIACAILDTAPILPPDEGRWIGNESARVRIEPDGSVSVYSGLASIGTGIETILSQIASEELSTNQEGITVITGDTSTAPFSNGIWGSRGAVVGGTSVALACRALMRKMKPIAARLLGVAEGSVQASEGHFFAEIGGPKVSFREVARAAYNQPDRLPAGITQGLEETAFYVPPDASMPCPVSSATHAAIVEVDCETGVVHILKYVAAHDNGRLINSDLVQGQLIGGIVQGIGGALYEELVYDENCQPLTTSFADYLLPRSVSVPPIELLLQESPSLMVPGGIKGCGEAGVICPPAAVANAVENALSPLNVTVEATPLSPFNVWQLIKHSRAGQRGEQ